MTTQQTKYTPQQTTVQRPTAITTPEGRALLSLGVNFVDVTTKGQPRLTKEELNVLIVSFIRGELNIDEFRLRVKKSKPIAYRMIRAFKASDDYVRLCEDEWDRMTFSKEFNDSIPATDRYQALTKVKVKLIELTPREEKDREKQRLEEIESNKILNAFSLFTVNVNKQQVESSSLVPTDSSLPETETVTHTTISSKQTTEQLQ